MTFPDNNSQQNIIQHDDIDAILSKYPDKIPIINIKKPNIFNRVKPLKNNTEKIKIKLPPHNGGDLGKFFVSCLCLE